VEMNNFSTSLFNGIVRWSLKIYPWFSFFGVKLISSQW
jgi:hypothetical protein